MLTVCGHDSVSLSGYPAVELGEFLLSVNVGRDRLFLLDDNVSRQLWYGSSNLMYKSEKPEVGTAVLKTSKKQTNKSI